MIGVTNAYNNRPLPLTKHIAASQYISAVLRIVAITAICNVISAQKAASITVVNLTIKKIECYGGRGESWKGKVKYFHIYVYDSVRIYAGKFLLVILIFKQIIWLDIIFITRLAKNQCMKKGGWKGFTINIRWINKLSLFRPSSKIYIYIVELSNICTIIMFTNASSYPPFVDAQENGACVLSNHSGSSLGLCFR